jgi:hypothetical protein
MSPDLVRAIDRRLGPARGGEIVTLASARRPAHPRDPPHVLRGRRRRDLILHGPEYGPADGCAVEISDGFALSFSPRGFLLASRVHPAADRDEEDAKAFVRFLARRRRIAGEDEARTRCVSCAAQVAQGRPREMECAACSASGSRRRRGRTMTRRPRPSPGAARPVARARCASSPRGPPPRRSGGAGSRSRRRPRRVDRGRRHQPERGLRRGGPRLKRIEFKLAVGRKTEGRQSRSCFSTPRASRATETAFVRVHARAAPEGRRRAAERPLVPASGSSSSAMRGADLAARPPAGLPQAPGRGSDGEATRSASSGAGSRRPSVGAEAISASRPEGLEENTVRLVFEARPAPGS